MYKFQKILHLRFTSSVFFSSYYLLLERLRYCELLIDKETESMSSHDEDWR